jgi:hypothetical protein
MAYAFWSYADMLTFLRELDVDIERLEELSHKNPTYLHKETIEGEVLLYWDWIRRRVMVQRNCVRVAVKAESGRWELVITKRVFTRDGVVDAKEVDWAVSETPKVGESAIATALRGLSQELGLSITSDQVLLHEDARLYKWWGHIYESTTYHGLLTRRNAFWLQVNLPKRPQLEFPAQEDNGVINHWRWRKIGL